ncbi:MAG: diguanylate cyclase [Devosia sp.]
MVTPELDSKTGSSGKMVCIIDHATEAGELAERLAALGYETVDLQDNMPPRDCLAVIIGRHIDPQLRLAQVLSEHHPVILIGDDYGFEGDLAAVRAGVRASLALPLDMVELGAWLTSLSESESQPYRIVVVEDDEIAAQTYALTLEEAGMKTTVVTNAVDACDVINRSMPDLVVMDMNMPTADGLEIASVLRLSRRNLSLPIIFLSSERDVVRQRAARKIGGDDFITKPVDLANLASLIGIRAERARALRQVMDRDSLTGLLNHARFKDRVADELSRSSRSGSTFSLCLLDLDHFKSVNDTQGHLSGDRVLRTLAQALQGALRQTDIIARYGGEEFAVLLLGTDAARARIVMDKVRTSFEKLRFDGPNGSFTVTLSVGVSCEEIGSNVEKLIGRADEALYIAKNTGRNRVVVVPAPLVQTA